MASFRNLVISLIRLTKPKNIATGVRALSNRPERLYPATRLTQIRLGHTPTSPFALVDVGVLEVEESDGLQSTMITLEDRLMQGLSPARTWIGAAGGRRTFWVLEQG